MTSENVPLAKPLTVKDLIAHLKTFKQDLPVFVRQEEDYTGDGADYWRLTAADVISGNVQDPETEKEYPALCIGDDRV